MLVSDFHVAFLQCVWSLNDLFTEYLRLVSSRQYFLPHFFVRLPSCAILRLKFGLQTSVKLMKSVLPIMKSHHSHTSSMLSSGEISVIGMLKHPKVSSVAMKLRVIIVSPFRTW